MTKQGNRADMVIIDDLFAPIEGAGPAAGKGCPKCGGLRQVPMGCVIGLPEGECEGKEVDVVGLGGLMGYAGIVGRPAEPESKQVPTPAKVFTVRAVAVGLVREDGKTISAPAMATFYQQAIMAEMSESVRRAVSLNVSPEPGSTLVPVEWRASGALRAVVEVRISKLPGNIEATNRCMSYMFELRDAVLKVINRFVPPEEAWQDVPQPQPQEGKSAMPNTVMDVKTIIEETTGQTTVAGSVSAIISWFAALMKDVAASADPAGTAAAHAETIDAHAAHLVAAVEANTLAQQGGETPPYSESSEPKQQAHQGGESQQDFSQSAQHG